MKKKLHLGKMINVWIQHHGYLDLKTDEQTIINFYYSVKKQSGGVYK